LILFENQLPDEVIEKPSATPGLFVFPPSPAFFFLSSHLFFLPVAFHPAAYPSFWHDYETAITGRSLKTPTGG